jgi:hypothetical protein
MPNEPDNKYFDFFSVVTFFVGCPSIQPPLPEKWNKHRNKH